MLSYRRGGVIGFLFAIVLTAPVRGADLDKLDCSAKMVPADVAFYSAMLRNKEQIDIVLASKAWARLRELPVVQSLWKRALDEMDKPGAPVAMYREFMKDPQNRELLDLLMDMGGQEIFFYGGQNSIAFMELAGQIYGGTQFQRMMSQMQQLGGDQADPKAQARAVLEIVKQHAELLQVPDLVMGFRTKDVKRAEAQLARLEKLAGQLLDQKPELKGRLKRTKIGDGQFLTLALDGELVPWDQIPIKDIEEEDGEFNDVIKKLKEMKLTISLGISGKYVLLGLGESTGHLAKFAAGKDRLVSRPEFKPLAPFADRRLTTIGYSSKLLQEKVAMTDKDVNDMVEFAKSMLPNAELNDAEQARVAKDIDELAKDVRKYLPKPGAQFSFSFLTDKGQESYGFDWGENNTRDGSKPLTLLNHVGGSPLMATVMRSKYRPEDYQLLVKWIKVFHKYFDDLAVPKMEDEQREKYTKFMAGALPLFKRLNETTEKLLLPALADGQAGIALDAKLTSKQWVAILPATETPLPMLELACVLGVSDAAKLRQACSEYWDVAKKMLVVVKDVGGEDFPDIELPNPQTKKGKSGELFTFPLPLPVPLDARLAPTAGLSDKVAVLTMSNDHAERLLKGTPLKTEGGPLADASRKRASATVFDWAGTVDALTPWIDVGVRMAAPLADPVIGDVKDLPAQVHTVLDVLKVLRYYSSATYNENGAWVTHGATLIQDVK